MKDLNGKTLIERVVDQVRLSKSVDEIWIATSTEPEDDLLELMGKELGVNVYRGSLGDVLKRYYDTMCICGADIVVRVTADNPFTEPSFIDYGLDYLLAQDMDYVNYDQVPYGTGVEIFKAKTLELAHFSAYEEYDREHVTPYIKKQGDMFKLGTLVPENAELRRPDISLTIDTMDDYVKLYKLIGALKKQDKVLFLSNAIEIYDTY
ncbi:3-deoxy-manno-octulosonate cytidylyltransferase [compost metagenome]